MYEFSERQIHMVQSYIDDVRNKRKLERVLQSASIEDRQRLLLIGGVDYAEGTLLHRAAWFDHLSIVQQALEGFTSDQAYEAIIRVDQDGDTVLHFAAHHGYADMLSYMLDRLTQKQRTDLLMLQNHKGNTALHRAADQSKTSTFQLILASVPADQQMVLLNMRNNQEKSIIELATPKIFCIGVACTKQALDDANQRIGTLEESNKELRRENDELAEEMERMAARQEQMQRVIEHLEIYIQTPFDTDATGDQELEELD